MPVSSKSNPHLHLWLGSLQLIAMLNVGSIVSVLNALGCEDPGPAGVWVTCRCPLAWVRHKSKKDSTPSFGVSIKTGVWNCFACDSGTLEDLVGVLEMYESKQPSGRVRDFQRARSILQGVELEEPLPEYGKEEKLQEFYPWSEHWTASFLRASDSPEASKYLSGRLVGVEQQAQFDLRWDSTRRMVVAPYRNVWGQLAGARGRAVDDWKGVRHHDYSFNGENNSALVLFNEQVISDAVSKHLPVILVEGQFDTMAVARVYEQVVGNLTAKPTPAKIATLNNCPEGVLLMLDSDAAGQEAAKKWAAALTVPVGVISYPTEFKDPALIPLIVLKDVLKDVL